VGKLLRARISDFPTTGVEICEARARPPEVPGILSGSSVKAQLLEVGMVSGNSKFKTKN